MHNSPSLILILSFLVIVVLVSTAIVIAASGAAERLGYDKRKAGLRAGVLMMLWLTFSGSLAHSGMLLDFDLPPRLPLLILLGASLSAYLAFSEFGTRILRGQPLWLLVAFNIFRLPLELMMHRAASEGVMPPQMSYSGQNYDIITGIFALFIAFRFYGREVPAKLLRIFNIGGLVFLINVVTIATLSMPAPWRVFMNEPANTWIATFPFVWLPTLLVPAALFTHLLLLRHLAAELSYKRETTNEAQ